MAKDKEALNKDIELVAAFTAAAKEQIDSPILTAGANAPIVSRRMRQNQENSNLTKFRNTPMTQDLVYDAAKNLERVKQIDKERREKLVKEETARYMFFLACRRYHHHGIYFTANPKALGEITDKDWYAQWRVTPEGKPDFSPYRGRIYCQGCYEDLGVKESLPIVWLDEERGLWQPEQRWAYMQAISQEDFERDGKRAIRVYELREEGSNMHFEQLEQQRAKWDAEHKKTEKVGA